MPTWWLIGVVFLSYCTFKRNFKVLLRSFFSVKCKDYF